MFQIESAHWFYKDFFRVQRPSLPKVQLRAFARVMFNHVPFLKIFLKEFDIYFKQWQEYKSNVPTYGAILLDDAMEHVSSVNNSHCMVLTYFHLSLGFNGTRVLFPNKLGFSEGQS